MIFMRGVIPDIDGWSIVHETNGDLHIRVEAGIITEDYLGQIVAINTTRQFLDVYIDGERILSSRDYGYTEPIAARYGIRATREMVGSEMRIVFSTPDLRENKLMGNSLSFQRVNEGFPSLDYSITAVCVAAGIAALVFAFAFGISSISRSSFILFALMNFTFALNTVRGDTLIGFGVLEPRTMYIASYTMHYIYMLPMLAFLMLTLTGIWKKCAFILFMSNALYPVAVLLLNMTRIMPVALSERGYNYVLSLSMTILTVMLAMQPTTRNRFSIIARIHTALWTIWGLSAAVRLLAFDMNIRVNVEYRLVYGFTLISLTFFGIYLFARNFSELQKREYAASVKAETLMQNYEQLGAHFHEIQRLKHDMRNHLSMLRIFLKDNRVEEAQNYLEKYSDEVDGITEAVYHEDYIVNAVAHDLLQRSKTIGANAELNLKASPLRISEPELISLLANITDNALEACAKMPEGCQRLIKLTITRREPYLAIICENSNPGGIVTDENGKLHSTKNETGHGYGLKTIERIATAYDGMVEVTHDENTFTITVALKDNTTPDI